MLGQGLLCILEQGDLSWLRWKAIVEQSLEGGDGVTRQLFGGGALQREQPVQRFLGKSAPDVFKEKPRGQRRACEPD